MEVRDYTPDDEDFLRKFHAQQGIDYQFPNLDDPLFFIRKVVTEEGRIIGASVLKICAETMLLLDPQQGPRKKMDAIAELQASVVREAREKGLDEIHAAIPAIGFDKRLRQLGWERDRPEFSLWTRRVR